MRIFFVTSKLNFKKAGGSIEEFDLMMKEFQKYGSDVTAVTVFSNTNDIDHPLPYKVIEEQITSAHLLLIQWQVYKILKKYESEADIFHIDGHLLLYGAGLYRRLGGKVPIAAFFNREQVSWPQITSSLFPKPFEHIFFRLKKRIRFLVERYIGTFLANAIDRFSFISPMFKKEYEDFGLRKDPKSLVISDPIDFAKLMKQNDVQKDSYIKRNKKNGPIIIFYSSRMAPGKGFDVLLSGFSKVKNKDNFKVILGGTGPEEPFVKEMIVKYGIEKYVELKGWVSKEDLFRLHREADIFIQADWLTYGTSISLLYAMAFGIPSILPASGGLNWVAKDSAVYFKNRDTDELARRIEELGRDANLRATLSQNSYKRLAEDELNFEKQVYYWHESMKEVVSANS